MSQFVPTMAEAQAIGLCWLARHKGLPPVAVLRLSVVQLHPESCGWCEYPPEALMAILQAFRPMATEEARWWALPGRARLEAIRIAQGNEVAA